MYHDYFLSFSFIIAMSHVHRLDLAVRTRHFVVSMTWFQYCYETIADCLERSTQLERLELFHIPLEGS